jgi:hypothetical protein
MATTKTGKQLKGFSGYIKEENGERRKRSANGYEGGAGRRLNPF